MLDYKVVLLITVLSFSSCISLVNYQSGKTLGEDNSELIISSEIVDLQEEDNGSIKYILSPGLSYYKGMNDKLDLGFRWEGGLAGSIGVKYQFLGNRGSKFAAALDPRFGVIAASKSSTGGLIPFGVLPIIGSYHPSDNFSINLASEFLYLPTSGDEKFIFSPSLGVEFGGDKYKFTVGGTYNYFNLNIYQFGAGFKIRI